MNKKDVSFIRKRLNPESHNPIEICACYVNTSGNVVSEFKKPLIALPQGEAERYMQLFKKTLSGDICKNLIELSFPLSEVMDGESYARLTEINKTAFANEDALNEFYAHVIESVKMDSNYIILMLHDIYDEPGDEGEAVFAYTICAICPVKPAKPALSYVASENDFREREQDFVVLSPEMGFVFPAYEDDGPNVSKALFYTSDTSEGHAEFISNVLAAKEYVPAEEQRQVFRDSLKCALKEECGLEVVKAVDDWLVEKLEDSKADGDSEQAYVGKVEIGRVLRECGVSEERANEFENAYSAEFAPGNEPPAASLISGKQLEIRTQDVVIKVNRERGDLIETRIIDGSKYLLIRADDGITVNGMEIDIK